MHSETIKRDEINSGTKFEHSTERLWVVRVSPYLGSPGSQFELTEADIVGLVKFAREAGVISEDEKL